MHYFIGGVIGSLVGFVGGVYAAGDVKAQLAAAHAKLDAILAVVRRG